ncbi:hypothetical protein HMPREF9098_0963 [Kingella denitrificans ATCC 33394]|uniref:Uncharacterized protein n=1 Tax=Kingella denitrificans ATCC 33394 TaxID=888741 RepID=F0EYM9_9NEIS|nr:hypothetical protein HMPREF9098_0963 [Kingella denitrificans ATCC 33394]
MKWKVQAAFSCKKHRRTPPSESRRCGKSSLHPAAALRYNLRFSALRAGCFSCV